MSTIVITNNQNLLFGIAQTITADDPYKDLSIADRLKNSLKGFSDIQVSLASDYQSGGFLNFGFVDGQTYRVTLDNYDVFYRGSISQFGSQISQIFVGSTNGVDYLLLEGQINYSGMPFFTSMANGSKLNVIEVGAGSFGSQSSISTAVVMVNLDGSYSSGALSGSINQISSGLFTKNSTSYAYFDKLNGGDIKFSVSNIGTVSAQTSVTGTKFTDLSISIVDYQTYSVIDSVAISNAVIDVTKKSSLALSSDGPDSFVLQGSLPSRVESGAGNDTITGSGFNDSVFGGDGKDSLIGLAGNDYLDGGAGDDTLNGSSGDDLYVVDSAGDVIKGEETYQASANFNPFSSANYSTNILQVKGTTSFTLANDQHIGFLTAGKYITNSAGGYDYLVTNTDSVNIKGNIFDERIDGNAAGNKLEGSGGNDGIDGKAGNDTLDGGDGNDWLDGGLGNDLLLGGAGDDTLWVDYGDFNIATSSYGPAGKDTLIGGAGNDKAYFALSESDYFVSKTDTTIMLTRKLDSTSVTTIDRTQANGVELISFQGGPTINVSDLISGAATSGNDNLFQRTSLSTTTPLTIDGLAGNDTITGTGFSDSLAGGEGKDSLVGLDGNDYLDGGAGDDTLNGGAGNDTVAAGDGSDLIIGGDGAGDDNYDGGIGRDTIKYTSSLDGITVNLADGTATSSASGDAAGIGTDVLTSIENVIAGYHDDSITGNADKNTILGDAGNDTLSGGEGRDYLNGGEGNDYLDGGAGVDLMIGGEGDDIYVVDTLRDVIIDQSGWDTIKSENLTEINLQRYRGIEAAEYTGTGAVTLIGSQSNNSLIGGTGADTLSGKFGNDILTGGDSADSFVFNAKLDAQFNFDQITDFSTGVDKLVLDKTIFTRFTTSVQDSNLVIDMDAQDSDDYLVYDSNTQTLYYDADGSAFGAKVAFAQVVGINSLSSADFSVI